MTIVTRNNNCQFQCQLNSTVYGPLIHSIWSITNNISIGLNYLLLLNEGDKIVFHLFLLSISTQTHKADLFIDKNLGVSI